MYCVRRGSNVKPVQYQPRPLGVRSPRLLTAIFVASLAFIASASAQPLSSATPPDDLPITVAAASPQTHGGVETDGSLEASAKRTRFVVGIDKRSAYSVFALTDPNRVVIELGDVRIDLPEVIGKRPVGVVTSFRGGLSAPGRQRVVIDVAAPVVIESQSMVKDPSGRGYQVVLDIVPAETTLGRAAAKLGTAPARLGVQPPTPRPAETPKQREARAFKPIIVIDPGHGGHDSGAMKYGTVEKEVVLAFSKILKDKLEATGRFKIMMTRETDVFVELDARRAYAERHNASLFIAVHADYASTRARGATIYTLRDGVADQLKRSAGDNDADHVLSKRETATLHNASGDADTVKGILADLARREVRVTKERTSIFARSVVATMSSSTNMRNDPDQQAAFRVLKTAQFPSVLIELAYVSNQQDAKLLKSIEWRNKVAGSITSAVENYFSHQLARLPL